MFELTDEEREDRLRYEYVYNRRGERWYPVRDGYLRGEREEARGRCAWKRYRGRCIVHTVADDEWHSGHVRVDFEFQPAMAKQTAADLNASLHVDWYNPTYDFVAAHGIRVGNAYACDKRRLVRGAGCPDADFDFDYVDAELARIPE